MGGERKPRITLSIALDKSRGFFCFVFQPVMSIFISKKKIMITFDVVLIRSASNEYPQRVFCIPDRIYGVFTHAHMSFFT